MEKATIYDFARMCRKYHYINCQSCPMWDERCNLRMMNDAHLDKANEIILKWCKEHPIQTRQSEFLKMFPNAKMDNHGVLICCPSLADVNFKCNAENVACAECSKEYWLAGVDE